MSNFEATRLYEQVIEEVITDSRQDFEDSGIDESTLQELRKIWCQKLSQSSIAKFSWDEEASREEEEALRQQQQQEQQQQEQQQVQQQQQQKPDDQVQQDDLLLQQQLHHEVLVPTQGDLHAAGLELPNTTLSYNTTTSVASNNMGLQIPGMKSEDDLGGDDNGLIIPRIGQADGTIEFTMYGGEAAKMMEKLKKVQNKKMGHLGQADGADDFDDDDIYNDSDDINSDLDDDVESDKEDDEDGQDDGQIMLCLYDKVQRVKNKWKSTLKEGVANINGRDYVFQKANGESEW